MLKPNRNETRHHVTADEESEPDAGNIPEQVQASVTGEDVPMEQEHPTAPGAIVWFTYPVVLIVILIIALAVVAWLQPAPL